jgi:hypothetical protein
MIFSLIFTGCIKGLTPSIIPPVFTLTNSTINRNTLTLITTTQHIMSTMTFPTLPSETPGYPNRFIETAGVHTFSYIPPKEWKSRERTINNLTMWVFGEGLRPSSNACRLIFAVNTSDYSDPKKIAEIEISKLLPGDTVVSRREFYTDIGLRAYKAVIIIHASDGDGKNSYYFVVNKQYVIIAKYDHLLGDHEEQDIIVDQSIKTIQFS